MNFNSHRSVVTCTNGCVASSQPLASQVGLDILKQGGNAADAAVATAAALNVTEPCSTGIGGDAFCLFYDAKTKSVKGLNGSGRAPAALSLERVKRDGFDTGNPIPVGHGHSVTVPGAAAAWADAVEKFGSGKFQLSKLLQPAIELAEIGFPVQKITAHFWNAGTELLLDPVNTFGQDMLLNGRAPRQGEIMRLPLLAKTFKELGTHGKKAFYEGRIAAAIVEAVQTFGGVMTKEDLQNHVTTFDEPISIDYKGYQVWEIPPNGQGITALIALNILEGIDLKSMRHNSSAYLHTLIEALRLSFSDSTWYCADPAKVHVPVAELLSKDYAAKRRSLIQPDKKLLDIGHGEMPGSDTVYFSVCDKEGNACSFINSNYMGFGSAIVPEGCGFTLQNRGNGFSLEECHPNVIAPYKRPYHTIIPAMVTSSATGELLASYGVMGAYMQPQGHVQVLLNMVEFGMDPQQALDQPRLCIGHGNRMMKGSLDCVNLEEGICLQVMEELKMLGHNVTGIGGFNRSLFGRGQVIARGPWPFNSSFDPDSLVYWAGSDPRADGMAVGF
ncbi:hypothetical protein ACJMK2_035057 [Sinanodonta woodiana]|uniref:Gamma-glutamyltransferase n=1 Tax=Sinanodonta woodiana TaxID=1069815 RepID=A0ABD3WX46_SINWO